MLRLVWPARHCLRRMTQRPTVQSDELAGLRKQLAPTEPPLERNVSSSSDESATEAEAEPLSNADTESGVAEVEPTAPPTKTSSRRSSKRGASTEAPSEDAENPACGFAGEYLQVELIGLRSGGRSRAPFT